MNKKNTYNFDLNINLKVIFIVIIIIFSKNIILGNTDKSSDLKYESQETYNAKTTANLNLYSNNCLLMDAESGNILFEKNGYDKIYPASTTKILTAIIALEYLDLNKSIVVSKEAILDTPAGSSIIYLKPGETFTLNDLLYGFLIKSGNDAGNVLAESVSGNIPAFIELMNKKLKEIGCENSHFTNAHGFHDENHYTTPYDMAKLMRYAMKNPEFKKIIETKTIEIQPTNKTPTIRKYESTNKMFFEKYTGEYYEYILGGKTGFTEEARGAFVGYGKKDDKLVITSVFDGPQNISGKEARFLDSATLLNFSFENFNKDKILNKENYNFEIIDKKNKKKYTIGLSDNIYVLNKNNIYNFNTYSLNLDINKLKSETIKPGDIVGNIPIKITGNSIKTDNSYNLVFVDKIDYEYLDLYIIFDKYYLVLPLIGLFILILILLNLLRKNSRKKKNKKIKNTEDNIKLKKKVNKKSVDFKKRKGKI